MDDDYQLDMVKRRKAELEAHLGVIAAQAKLRLIYQNEVEEIDSFLEAVDARIAALTAEQEAKSE